ncbi:hypothetical protein DFH08DRAFT_1087672 [Mycena albidolilacea]|uniref:Uncharacterized protein n=1 Tax=Mycena albidolilacea TaxID=1033008 RepID=A0AAD7EC98_9AGAR|nr:hypothetical protein DFH08DRAFT_1087672 [Mycena albidolilacea]
MPAEANTGVKGWDDGYAFSTATATAKASYSTSETNHPADQTPFGSSGTIASKTEYLTAQAGSSAGSYTGVDASAHLITSEDPHSRVKIGLGVDTGAGLQNGNVKAAHRRTVGVYLAEASYVPLLPFPLPPSFPPSTHPSQFALANWLFLDACILSAHAKAPWGEPDTPGPLPGLCSLLGFLVNLINKERVRGDADTFGDARAVWRARLFLFIGFALMAGGMAGSAVRGSDHQIRPLRACGPVQNYGYASVAQNLALMLSVVVLWIAQNASDEYEYNVTL